MSSGGCLLAFPGRTPNMPGTSWTAWACPWGSGGCLSAFPVRALQHAPNELDHVAVPMGLQGDSPTFLVVPQIGGTMVL